MEVNQSYCKCNFFKMGVEMAEKQYNWVMDPKIKEQMPLRAWLYFIQVQEWVPSQV